MTLARITVLVSGRGSNLGALLAAERAGAFAGSVTHVISNRPGAGALDLAREHGVSTEVVDHKAFATREAFDAALCDAIDRSSPDLVVLAGFMRVLSDETVHHYAGRMLNIHPSLLPSFPGLHTHMHALAAGVKLHGCTVHVVTPALDNGPIVIQAAVPVLPNDTEDSLSQRVLAAEHRIYPQAVRWFLEDRVEFLADDVVRIKGSGVSGDCVISPRDAR